MEVKPPEMEEDRVPEALAVPVPARHPLDPLDPRVHRLRRRVRRLRHHCVQDPLEVRTNHPRRPHRAHCPNN